MEIPFIDYDRYEDKFYFFSKQEEAKLDNFLEQYEKYWFDGLNDFLDYGELCEDDTKEEIAIFKKLYPLYLDLQEESLEVVKHLAEEMIKIDNKKLIKIEQIRKVA